MQNIDWKMYYVASNLVKCSIKNNHLNQNVDEETHQKPVRTLIRICDFFFIQYLPYKWTDDQLIVWISWSIEIYFLFVGCKVRWGSPEKKFLLRRRLGELAWVSSASACGHIALWRCTEAATAAGNGTALFCPLPRQSYFSFSVFTYLLF